MPKIYATATPAGCQPWCSPKHHQVCNGPVCSPHLHRDVTPDPQPYRDDMFVSVCSCGAEFLGDDPDDADYLLDCHMRGDHPCGCPNDVITSAPRRRRAVQPLRVDLGPRRPDHQPARRGSAARRAA